jgi:peptide/nickel transport system ATP-binding protein
MTDAPLLAVRGLSIKAGDKLLLSGVDLEIGRGRTLALIGESGSGKSMTALAAMGLLPIGVALAGGTIALEGEPLPLADERRMAPIRGRRMAIVFQDPMACLNPFMTVGAQVEESLAHAGMADREERRRAVLRLFGEVDLPEPAKTVLRHPHELSGGQQQRVMIAMAIAGEPDLLIADEPTSSLDASVGAGVLDLLVRLQRDRGMAMLFITHDLAVAGRIAHDVAVMQDGRVVESGPVGAVLRAPQHPYSQRLTTARQTLQAARRPSGGGGEAVLELDHVAADYRGRGLFTRPFRAVHDASLVIEAGRTLGILGESGSGKSTLAGVAGGLIAPAAGTVSLFGDRLVPGRRLDAARRRACQVVFQNPYGAFNPRRTVGEALREPLRLMQEPAASHAARIEEALLDVRLDMGHAARYPHQLSGGQRQRASIARALLCRPRLLICDEVVSALDMTVQVQVLELLRKLQASYGFGMLFIGHDAEIVRWIADDIIVMLGGRIIDRCTKSDLDAPERHAYVRRLVGAAPMLNAA